MSRGWLLLSPPPSKTHDLPPAKSVIHTESRAKGDSQLKHSATHGFAIAEIFGAHPGQASVHRHLHSLVAKRIEPLVKRDESVQSSSFLISLSFI